MALPILDGNQSAATLSTIITGGSHIPAHTVVSLGSQAISDITSAISGSVVSVSNFPASQSTTFGAVTGSISIINFPATQSIAGTVTAGNIPVVNNNTGGSITSGVPIAFYDSDLNSQYVIASDHPLPVDLPNCTQNNNDGIPSRGVLIGWADTNQGEFVQVSDIKPLPVSASGTVTVGNVSEIVGLGYTSVAELFSNEPVYVARDNLDDLTNLKTDASKNLLISGTVTANVFGYDLPNANVAQIPVHNYDEGFSAGIKAVPALIGNEFGGFNNSNPLPISGTVTANNPSGALTTRFGSVTTANTAQITSAVTNANRKYLLAQNISAGTVTIGIGFSPTTTQGIQLTAGGGLTFDAFCPTGAVYWLGAVTGANYCLIEG